jgi:hypothetical protein
MQIDTELILVCKEFGPVIQGLTHEGAPVDGARLMLTFSGLESNFGKLREFVRYEKGYAPGGTYYNNSEVLRADFRRFGCLASSSYGSFQIMFPTAKELGFKGHPIELQKDKVSGYWAMQLIVQRFIGRFKAKTLRDVLDAYNSGNHVDRHIPTVYIAKGIEFYGNIPV